MAPQRPLHLKVESRRIGLIGSVHMRSLVSKGTASGGRTTEVRETKVDQTAA